MVRFHYCPQLSDISSIIAKIVDSLHFGSYCAKFWLLLWKEEKVAEEVLIRKEYPFLPRDNCS